MVYIITRNGQVSYMARELAVAKMVLATLRAQDSSALYKLYKEIKG